MLILKTRCEISLVRGIASATQDKAVYVLKLGKLLRQSNDDFSTVQSKGGEQYHDLQFTSISQDRES